MKGKDRKELGFSLLILAFAVLMSASSLLGSDFLSNLFGLLVAGACAELSRSSG